MSRLRLLFGVNVFWLAVSMLSEGLGALLLPALLLGAVNPAFQATVLGGLTFVGLALGILVQPVAGLVSDRQRPWTGRRPLLALGTSGVLLCLVLLGASRAVSVLFAAYALLQVALAVAQAAYQGWLPDLVPQSLRGLASGFKGLMDLGGALLAFMLLGSLLGQGRVTPALLALGVTLALAFVVAWLLIREPPRALTPPHHLSPATMRAPLAAAFRFDLRQHRQFAWLITARFLFLLGTYAVGRFFLFFIADRLRLDAAQAAQQAGTLLAALTLVTALAAPVAGWAADRLGRVPLMITGAALSALGTLLLILAASPTGILVTGGLMALGSAAFSAANWAQTADLAPPNEAARFFGLANFGTAGAVAVAGLFGPLIDGLNAASPSLGYTTLFALAAALAVLSGLAAIRARPAPRAPGLTATSANVKISPDLPHSQV